MKELGPESLKMQCSEGKSIHCKRSVLEPDQVLSWVVNLVDSKSWKYGI
jgi:hypothetical protein